MGKKEFSLTNMRWFWFYACHYIHYVNVISAEKAGLVLKAVRSYGMEQVFHVIDSWARSQLSLIVTTNLSLEEPEHPSTLQLDRALLRA